MLTDRVRLDRYRAAIQQTVRPGDIVVDIGTGSGILAFFALQAGAARVYAIEHRDVIADAQELSKINGFDHKIVFLKERSDRVTLPEMADVVLSETIGFFGLEENSLLYFIDARRRFLKPGGRFVPRWLELFFVPIESDSLWQEFVGVWSADFYGIDFSPVQRFAVCERHIVNVSGRITRLARPALIAHLDYNEAQEHQREFSGTLAISRNGILHGYAGYFRAGLTDDVVLSTAPDDPLTHWHQSYFPLRERIKVETGDIVTYGVELLGGGPDPCWRWRTSFERRGVKIAEFDQSNDHRLTRIDRNDKAEE